MTQPASCCLVHIIEGHTEVKGKDAATERSHLVGSRLHTWVTLIEPNNRDFSKATAAAIVSALVIALFYTLGWQFWGQDWWINWWYDDIDVYAALQVNHTVVRDAFEVIGPVASLPPSRSCPFSNQLPWYYGSVVLLAPLNLAVLVLVNIRSRDLPGVFIASQTLYAIQGALGTCRNDTCALPTYVTSFLVAFAGGCLAEINEMVTNFSKHATSIAMVFMLAPGSMAVSAVIGAYRITEGDYQGFNTSLWESVVFIGTTYAMGFYLSFLLFEPFRAFRLRAD